MSDDEEPQRIPLEDSAPARIKRRSKLRGVLLAVVLVGFTLAGVLWASRPHWRTYISPVNETSGLRIAVQMPDSWTLDIGEPLSAYDTNLFFHKKPTTDIGSWIDKMIWHMDDNEDSIRFQLSSRSNVVYEAATLDQTIWQTQAALKRSGTQVTLRHVRYSVGPGLEISITRRSGTMHSTYAIILFPDGSSTRCKVVIRLIYQGEFDHFNHFRSIFEEAARRIRLLAP